MLHARHHPRSLQDLTTAEQLLNKAWAVLENMDSEDEQVIYEKVFNRNGFAYVLYRRKEYDKVASLLERHLTDLEATRFANTVHHTVLLNNLGRLYALLGRNDQAEEKLRRAVDLDPDFAEYWSDLASLLIDLGRYDNAVAALKEAERCSDSIAGIFALRGYLEYKLNNYAAAAQYYERAFARDPSNAELALDAAEMWAESGEAESCRAWIQKARKLPLVREQQERADLIELQAAMREDGARAAQFALQRLRKLAEKYPDSDIIMQNIHQLISELTD